MIDAWIGWMGKNGVRRGEEFGGWFLVYLYGWVFYHPGGVQ